MSAGGLLLRASLGCVPVLALASACAAAPRQDDAPPNEHDGPISTDRPGFSDSSTVVPVGAVQLEGGATYSIYRDSDAQDDLTLGELSLRMGLTPTTELRLKANGYSFTDLRVDGVDDDNDGLLDGSLGLKLDVADQDGWVPDLALIPALSLPIGADGKSTDEVDPEVRLAWSYAVGKRQSVYGVLLAAGISDDRGRFFQGGGSLATSYVLREGLSAFAEVYGVTPVARSDGPASAIDGGLVFLLAPDMQLDLADSAGHSWRVGWGLSDDAPDVFAGAGLCVRW